MHNPSCQHYGVSGARNSKKPTCSKIDLRNARNVRVIQEVNVRKRRDDKCWLYVLGFDQLDFNKLDQPLSCQPTAMSGSPARINQGLFGLSIFCDSKWSYCAELRGATSRLFTCCSRQLETSIPILRVNARKFQFIRALKNYRLIDAISSTQRINRRASFSYSYRGNQSADTVLGWLILSEPNFELTHFLG